MLIMLSVLLCCWLGDRKGIRPAKTEWWGAGVVICLERGADLHMAQLMPLPLIVSCFSKIQIGFTFLVLAYLGSPRKRAIKQVCVLMRVLFHSYAFVDPMDRAVGIVFLCCPFVCVCVCTCMGRDILKRTCHQPLVCSLLARQLKSCGWVVVKIREWTRDS